MRVAKVHLRSLSPYSPSKRLPDKTDAKESHDAFERRVWRERIHTTPQGLAFIPPMAFKYSLDTAASFLRMKIPGKGNSEYGKHIKAGVLVPEGLVLSIKQTEVEGEWLYLDANGKRGSGTRVPRCMPVFREWDGIVRYVILDETVTPEVFERHLREAGNIAGIGRFRPENRGYYGRYAVEEIEWEVCQ